MSLRLAGHLIIGSVTPQEDPVTIGYVWVDTGTSKLKICTAVTPAYVWAEISGTGGASAWGDITGTLSNQTDLQTALDGKAALAHKTRHEDGGADEISVLGLSGLLADSQNPLAHKTSHQSGGSDAIKLDDLAATDDNTDLNASLTSHGLMRKYPGQTALVLRADGSFTSTFSQDSAITWAWSAFGVGAFSLLSGRSARGTFLAPLRTKSNDALLVFSASGYNAVDDVATADPNAAANTLIQFMANQDHTASAQGTKILFRTTPDGSTTVTTRWTIGADGGLTPTAPAYLNVKLDDLIAADDNTDLDASTSAHGLMQKYPGGTTTFLRADGTFATPTATPPVLVGPNNKVSTVEAIAANTFVHVGRQLEITSTGSIEIPSTSTLEISA